MHSTTSKRSAGVLLHISSLPSGNIGADAYKFIDFLASIGASVWQTLPINMPANDSPYQCISTHAGNPNYICYKKLIDDGLLNADEANLTSERIFEIAYERFLTDHPTAEFNEFCESEHFWLDDFAIYLLLRKQFDYSCWNTWPDIFKHREKDSLNQFSSDHAHALEVVKFTQYLFFTQWAKLKEYAKQKKVQLFGDIPIFVAYDSADVWAQPYLFKLDKNKEMTVVAGVPPDYFSETGQRWGNPHYDWQEMEKNHFIWWLSRIETLTHLFDMVRIDHFRGLEAAWEIPANEPNAIKGTWVKAPGDALLATIQVHFPDIQLIAEDLGIITNEVNALRLKYGLPGMKILQFAFSGEDNNPYLPHNIEENSVTYTGTHDNDTTLGWYQSINENERHQLEAYLDNADEKKPIVMPFTLIDVALKTKSQLVIIPMQDVLELGTEHRMNVPGTTEGNWQWHFNWDQLNESRVNQFAEAIRQCGRNQ
jgi:4-alpha-glucanotransferase